MDFSIWAFVIPDGIAAKWHATMIQLPSRLSSSSSYSSDGKQQYQIEFKHGMGRVSLGCLDSDTQLWVLEASGKFSPIFHWLLRYYGATCIPKSVLRDTCSIAMFAHEVRSIDVGLSLPNHQVEASETSPLNDLAIISYLDKESSHVEYRIQTHRTSFLVIAETRSTQEDGSVPKELSKCTEANNDLTFSEVWKFR